LLDTKCATPSCPFPFRGHEAVSPEDVLAF
jgi:hypothetical protein